MEDRTLLATFLVTNTDDTGPGSLRQAILDANAKPGSDVIGFAILGDGVHTIAPTSSLPAISDPAIVDGTSQPGYEGTPRIELSGSQVGTADGLTITGPGVTVRGLAIGGFAQGAGILITGAEATGDVIEANVIGADPNGEEASPNYFGIRIVDGAHDNLVGGATSASGNLITDNLGPGVTVSGDGSVGNRITANRIYANDTPPTTSPTGMLQFDGSSYVSLPGDLINYRETTGDVTLEARTIEAWFQTTRGGVIFGCQNIEPSTNPTTIVPSNRSRSGPLLYVGIDGRLYGKGRFSSAIITDSVVNDGRWHHVALVMNRPTIALFLDGQFVGSGSRGSFHGFHFNQIGTSNTGPSDPATPGGWYGFQGQIDDVRIWGVGRSADEIRQDMTAAPSGTEPGLVADYRFDEGRGLTAHDTSPNRYDGMLAGTDGHLPRWSSSGGLAIDQGGDGLTRNSTSTPQGHVRAQNHPVIVSAADGRFVGWLSGSLSNTPYHLEFFAGADHESNGAGQAQVFLGSLEVTTDGLGQAVFEVPFTPPADKPLLTATATDPRGNTSEVSTLRRATFQTPKQSVRLASGDPLDLSAAEGEVIALHDPDAGPLDPAWELSLSVPAGTLTLSGTDDLLGAGNGTEALHYRGPLSALNAALEGLRFTPLPGLHGNTLLSLDAGSAGAPPLRAHILITDGQFLVTTTADGGPGSLRQAILDANAATGSNTIEFAIPGTGVHIIAPRTPLPPITGSTLIDGSSQPGYAGTSRIAIDTSSSGMAGGLTITGSNVSVRDLASGGFVLGAANLSQKLTLYSGLLQGGESNDAGEVDTYRIETRNDGRLFVQLQSRGITTRLSLHDAQGRLLVQSDGLSATHPEGQVDQHLTAGTYLLRVASTGGAGDYTLTASLTPASPPFQAIPVGSPKYANPGWDPLVVGDFNGDGVPDLAAMDGIHLAVGDGTFRLPLVGLRLSVANPDLLGMVCGDFNGDGNLDLVIEEPGDIGFLSSGVPNTVMFVALGNGDGTLQVPKAVAAGTYGAPESFDTMAAVDFSGDGILDLAVINRGAGGVSLLLGKGDGTFQAAVDYAAATQPAGIVASDFNDDGHFDLAVGNIDDNTLSVLSGNGDGTFQTARTFSVGTRPMGLVAGDFNNDGRLDLGAANLESDDISVLLGNGDGTFQLAVEYAAGRNPYATVSGDFNGDGRLDLAVTNYLSKISVLLGNGDGTFQAPRSYATAVSAFALESGDFNGDGRLDLATVDWSFNSISVLLGNGDGTFAEQPRTDFGSQFAVSGDFNGDGRLDLAGAISGFNSVSLLLGNGDGTFQTAKIIAVGGNPTDLYLVAEDFNGDGRLDLAITVLDADGLGAISILLGNGDGTFQAQSAIEYLVGSPFLLAAVDLNRDGNLDLVVPVLDEANFINAVAILLGNGDGTFQPAREYLEGQHPSNVLPGDINGDGNLDLAVEVWHADGSRALFVLLGDGDDNFQTLVSALVVDAIVAASDFNGDGRIDLLGRSSFSDGVGIVLLRGEGDGTFHVQTTVVYPGKGSLSVLTGDFNADGTPDVAVTAWNSDGTTELSILPGKGDGTFQAAISYASLVTLGTVGDFNNDGRTDLPIANLGDSSYIRYTGLSVLLGTGTSTLADPGQLATTPHATPLVADLNGDVTDDLLVVDGAGDILYRQGQPGRPGSFDPPIAINPGFSARDFAWVPNTDQGPLIAGVDTRHNAVSLYAWRDGTFSRIGSLATGPLPAQIIAADLDQDGWTDLVVRDAGDGALSIYFGRRFDRSRFIGPINPQFVPPGFQPLVSLSVGMGVSDVQAVDTTGNGVLDLVVTNKLTAQVSLLRNLGNRLFARPSPYRAGTGLSRIETGSGSPEVMSLESTIGVAAGPFTPGGPADLVTLNPGSKTIGLLTGLGQGRFANPVALYTGNPARVVRVADFNHDGIPDLALLSAQDVTINLGDGKRSFSQHHSYDAGPDPSGLTISDVDHDGNPDVLIGNSYGDVLVLLGQGDGTLRPYRKADQSVVLAVADLTGDGQPDFVFADQGLDRVVVRYGDEEAKLLGDRSTGLLSPGAVKLVDLTADGVADLVVANSGSNNVLVYPGTGDGQFAPAANDGHGFFTGTNPTGLEVADLNGDGRPDLLVANSGSNDVSVLLGQGSGSTWTMSQGPRIKTDAGPVAVATGDILGTGKTDLAVANRQANNVQVFPGVGGGFFNDQAPRTYAAGQQPSGLFVGNFGGAGTGLATTNAGSNDVSVINPGTGQTQTLPAGGLRPTSGFAGDFNGDGLSDLVVGHNGSGAFSLFLGEADGLGLSQTLSSVAVPAPTSLSFAGVADGTLSFYAATAGRETASLLTFNLSIPVPPGGEAPKPDPQPPVPTTPAGAFQQVAQFLGLRGSALDLIAPLLTVSVVTVEPNAGSSVDEVALLANFLPSMGTAALQRTALLLPEDGSSGETAEQARDRPEDREDQDDVLPPWARLAAGLEEALERLRIDILKNEGIDPHAVDQSASPTADEPPAPRHVPDGPARQSRGLSRPGHQRPGLAPSAEHPQPGHEAALDRIDAAIHALADEPSSGLSIERPSPSDEQGREATGGTHPVSPIIVAAAMTLASAGNLAGWIRSWRIQRRERIQCMLCSKMFFG